MNPTDFALSGVYAAVLTPQTPEGAVDGPALSAHCRWLLDHGCHGLAVLGTTGEANSFSLDERLALLDTLAESGLDMSKTLPGVGCCAVPDTIALARRALDLGASGVLTLPPFYYKSPSDDGLFAAFAQIIEGLADPRLRLFLYHFPQMSGIPIPHRVIARLRQQFPGIIAGVKDSSGDLDNMVKLTRDFPGLAVFAGSDELLRPLLLAGGAGCITAVANLAAPLARQVYDRIRVEGMGADDATGLALHDQLTQVRKVIASRPMVAALKEVMANHSQRAAWRHLRPPLMALDAEAVRQLHQDFAATGYEIPACA